jgi:hypothetical protein
MNGTTILMHIFYLRGLKETLLTTIFISKELKETFYVIIFNLYVDNIFVAFNDLTLLKETKGSIHSNKNHGRQGQSPYEGLHFTRVMHGLIY